MFSFCNPAQVRQQVILPVSSSRYKAADGVDIDDHVIFSESFRPKESLKAKQPESPRTQHQRLEEEIFLLTLDLFVSHAALLDFEQELLKKSSTYGGIIYQCQHAGATATSELVQQLRYTLQKYGQAIQSVSIKENKLSPIALKQLIELLRSYQEFSPSTKASSPYKGNCFTSIRHALIITVSF
ncbi:hypothetical protein EON65_07635 [archaeon]|nr:MAG: hypothetical protein EON65_07635 [archaeon]